MCLYLRVPHQVCRHDTIYDDDNGHDDCIYGKNLKE